MAHKDIQVVGVDPGLFWGSTEEVVGSGGQKLVQGKRRCHQNGGGNSAPASRTAHLLPGRGHAAGIPVKHRELEGADVDTQLECVCADHAGEGSVAQVPFDRTTFIGEVTASIAGDGIRRKAVLAEDPPDVSEKQFDVDPGSCEDDGADAV